MAENLVFTIDVDNSKAIQSFNSFFDTVEQGAARAKAKLNTALNQELETEIKIEFKGGKLVAKEVQKARQESNRMNEIWKAVNGKMGRTPNQLKKQLQILKSLRGDIKKYKANQIEVTQEWKLITEKIKKAEKAQKRMTGGGGMASFLGKFALIQTAANLATAGIMAVGRSIQGLIQTAGRMEVLNLQIEAFTGSAGSAKETMKAFADIAARTPFDLEQVASAGKIMMAFGLETEEAVDATDQLGIIAAATGGDLNLMARNLGQISAQGQAYTRDLTQFAIAGVPIWEEMSKVTGKSVSALKRLASEGKISIDVVQAAFANLTKEGSRYKEIADRMQETFQGRLAKIASDFQLLALAAIDTFNTIDRALGKVLGMDEGLVSGLMKAFGDGIKFVSENLDGMLAALLDVIPAVAALGTAFAIINWLAIAKAVALVVAKILLKTVAIWKAVKAQYALLAAMGPKGWAIMLGAAVATGAAVASVTGKLREALKAQQDFKDEQKDASDAAKELAKNEQSVTEALAEQDKIAQKRLDTMKMLKAEAKITSDEAKANYDREKTALDELKSSVMAKLDQQKAGNKEIIDNLKTRLDMEKEIYKSAKEAMKDRYEAEKTELDSIYDRKLEALGLETAELNKQSQAERALLEIEKRELRAKLQSGDLNEKETLQTRARLDQMRRSEELAKVAVKRKKAEKEKAEELLALEQKRKLEAGALDERFKKTENSIKEQVDGLKSVNASLDQQKAEIDSIVDNTQVYTGTVQEGIGLIAAQADKTAALKGQWDSAANSLRIYTQQLASANAERARAAAQPISTTGGNATGGLANRFAGGPVSGGSKYTVNELGQESFLSSSGKLSMIKAPAFGSWKAPSSGSVIPAHLTNQLSIPSSGIQVNTTTKVSSRPRNEIAALAAALSGSNGQVTNNVTIQSANTRQQASDTLVQLAKLKRLRYN